MARVTRRTLLVLAVAVAAAAPGHVAAKLPPGALRGPAHELEQYPTVSLATASQKAAARRLLNEVRTASARWEKLSDAALDGYANKPRPRRPGDRRVYYFHAGRAPGPPNFDPERPKSVIYANAPGSPLVLVGLMFAMPRGERGPNPGGPITRWHTHAVCITGDDRGTPPRRDGSCPPGSRKRQGSEMMHIWLTGDLRSAFAIHAPVHELCLAGRIPASSCHHSHH